jgi:hypothetical protein
VKDCINFNVGPFVYRLVVSDRAIFDGEGEELEGVAVEGRRLLILSRIVEVERREDVALHEFTHAWAFHVPKPSDEEERCQLTALVAQQFALDLERQGGREALRELPSTRVPHLGRPKLAAKRVGDQAFRPAPRRDKVFCGQCESPVMCGSIHNGDVEYSQDASEYRLPRWMRCPTCGAVQVWMELCTPGGSPLGAYVANPPPRLLYGVEAERWIADQKDMGRETSTGPRERQEATHGREDKTGTPVDREGPGALERSGERSLPRPRIRRRVGPAVQAL